MRSRVLSAIDMKDGTFIIDVGCCGILTVDIVNVIFILFYDLGKEEIVYKKRKKTFFLLLEILLSFWQ